MKKIISSIFLLNISFSAMAQVPLNPILEHFTNTKCSICASRNPGLKANVDGYGTLNYLSIHPSAPYSGCILSIQNKTDNDERTKLYGIFGSTPRITINGNIISVSTDYSSAATINPYVGLTSPFSMRVVQNNYGTDSISATVIIKKYAAFSESGSLFIGLAEDTIFVDGGNGEKQHYNVLRNSMTGSTHLKVGLNFPIGDSIMITRTANGNSNWNMNRMFAMAILYDSTNNKVIQSEKSEPLGATTSIKNINGTPQLRLAPNPSNGSLLISIDNNNDYMVNIFSVTGNKISSFAFNNSNNINTQNFPNGMYVIEISDGVTTEHHKFVVQH